MTGWRIQELATEIWSAVFSRMADQSDLSVEQAGMIASACKRAAEECLREMKE